MCFVLLGRRRGIQKYLEVNYQYMEFHDSCSPPPIPSLQACKHRRISYHRREMTARNTSLCGGYPPPFPQGKNLIVITIVKLTILAMFCFSNSWLIANLSKGHKSFFYSSVLRVECSFKKNRFLPLEISLILYGQSATEQIVVLINDEFNIAFFGNRKVYFF